MTTEIKQQKRVTVSTQCGKEFILERAVGRALHKIAKTVRDHEGTELVINSPFHEQIFPVTADTFKDQPLKNLSVILSEAYSSVTVCYTDQELEEFHEVLNQLSKINSDTAIFIDIDGVAGDFDRHYIECFGAHYLLDTPHAMWTNIDTRPGYYKDQPLYPLFLDFYNAIRHLDVKFLSSCRIPRFAYDKDYWLGSMLGRDATLQPVFPNAKGAFDKTEHFIPGSVLIDDYDFNNEQWSALGGIGISHSCVTNTARQLLNVLQPTAGEEK